MTTDPLDPTSNEEIGWFGHPPLIFSDTVPNQPGRLLHSEPLTARWVPSGARAWRILYTTTLDEGRPAIASGFVLAPRPGDADEAPLDLIAWGHGTTGVAAASAPSLLSKGPAAGALHITQHVLDAGWALVGTDYA